MKFKKLGDTDMEISAIGFGAWALGGGGWQFSWGPQDERASIAAIRRALELGVNWIDTAAVYGLGHSEEVVAKALEGITRRPFVFTKCERCWNEKGEIYGSLSAASIRSECEASLRRLRTEVIDLYQIHWPEPEGDIEEGWETLINLKKEGKVRHIGVSNFDVAQLRRAERLAPVSSLQPPYSVVRPQVEKEILPYCLESTIGVIVYAPMMSGMLSGAMTRERIALLPPDDWRRRSAEFQEPRLTQHLATAEKLRQIGDRHGVTPGVVAIAWTLRHPAVTGAIVGARSAAQVDGIIAAGDFRLTHAEIAEIGPA
jgi:aryl-alcohol dehydrogenase-like predicted oxidoreductase